MIYADPSFLMSLYGWDDNTDIAQETYGADARRPLVFTPWQRFEVRNAIRMTVHRLKRAGQVVPFAPGNILKRLEGDLATGLLKHQEPDWRDTLRLAEELSRDHTEAIGCAAVDLWHVSAAAVLRVDTFWTFDSDQRKLAVAVARFRRVPDLLAKRT